VATLETLLKSSRAGHELLKLKRDKMMMLLRCSNRPWPALCFLRLAGRPLVAGWYVFFFATKSHFICVCKKNKKIKSSLGTYNIDDKFDVFSKVHQWLLRIFPFS